MTHNMNRVGHKIKSILIVCIFSLFIVGCGTNPDEVQIVKDLEISATQNDDAEVILGFSMLLDIGQMSLPSVDFTIVHPETGHDLGQVSLLSSFDGSSEIGISVNLTGATNGEVSSGDANLPNGKAIPVGGVDNSKILALPVADSGVIIYIGLDTGMALAGVAVPIAQFDQIGGSIGGANIFPVFDIQGVKGIAGLFTGSGSGENGLAIFFDFSSVVDPSDLLSIGQSAPLEIQSMSMARSLSRSPVLRKAKASKMYFYPSSTSSRKMDTLSKKIYRLDRKSAKLKVR
ncbi:MAG: hypothetical protein HOE90_17250 [Bacteriovoracaceae bacterium]|jgi:hypothetical protein|nr:hypothetical protein [Bacteriovoracaceae bacterium]